MKIWQAESAARGASGLPILKLPGGGVSVNWRGGEASR